MGIKNVCLKCGNPKKSSKKSRMYRKLVNQTAQLPELEFLRQALKDAEKYCNECWKEHVLPVAQGFVSDL